MHRQPDPPPEEEDRQGLPRQHGLCRSNRVRRLAAIGAAALGHVGAAAATLAAQRFHACTDQIDRADLAGQVIGHGCGDAGLAVIHRHDHRYAAAKALLGLIEQPAQVLGIEPIEHLAGEFDPANVFIRGTEGRHTILLIDGVRYGSATAGTPVWDAVPVDMIERIEVLKGPASALYGSEGVGGVVQIFTRRGQQGLHPYASVTVGSESHRQAAAGVTGGQGAWTYALGVQTLREKGFSSTNPRVQFGNYNSDTDGFDQDSLNASLGLRINDAWSADASVIYSDGLSQIDDGPGRDAQTAVAVGVVEGAFALADQPYRQHRRGQLRQPLEGRRERHHGARRQIDGVG